MVKKINLTDVVIDPNQQSNIHCTFGSSYIGSFEDRDVVVREIELIVKTKLTAEQQEILRNLENDIIRIGSIRHANLSKILAFSFEDGKFSIISESFPSNNLLDVLTDEGQLALAEKLSIASQIGQAIQFVHELDHAHGNIKMSNILIDKKKPYHAQLCDLVINPIKTRHAEFTGYYNAADKVYGAPELKLRNRQPTKQSDVYSFAVTLFELFTMKPYEKRDHDLTDLDKVTGLNSDIVKYIKDCLVDLPAKRPPVSVLVDAFKPLLYQGTTVEADIQGHNNHSPAPTLRLNQQDDVKIATIAKKSKDMIAGHFNTENELLRMRVQQDYGQSDLAEMTFKPWDTLKTELEKLDYLRMHSGKATPSKDPVKNQWLEKTVTKFHGIIRQWQTTEMAALDNYKSLLIDVQLNQNDTLLKEMITLWNGRESRPKLENLDYGINISFNSGSALSTTSCNIKDDLNEICNIFISDLKRDPFKFIDATYVCEESRKIIVRVERGKSKEFQSHVESMPNYSQYQNYLEIKECDPAVFLMQNNYAADRETAFREDGHPGYNICIGSGSLITDVKHKSDLDNILSDKDMNSISDVCNKYQCNGTGTLTCIAKDRISGKFYSLTAQHVLSTEKFVDEKHILSEVHHDSKLLLQDIVHLSSSYSGQLGVHTYDGTEKIVDVALMPLNENNLDIDTLEHLEVADENFFQSGVLQHMDIFKRGAKTGITEGKVIRPKCHSNLKLNTTGYIFGELFAVVHATHPNIEKFADHGDSGALVMAKYGNKKVALGIVHKLERDMPTVIYCVRLDACLDAIPNGRNLDIYSGFLKPLACLYNRTKPHTNVPMPHNQPRFEQKQLNLNVNDPDVDFLRIALVTTILAFFYSFPGFICLLVQTFANII